MVRVGGCGVWKRWAAGRSRRGSTKRDSSEENGGVVREFHDPTRASLEALHEGKPGARLARQALGCRQKRARLHCLGHWAVRTESTDGSHFDAFLGERGSEQPVSHLSWHHPEGQGMRLRVVVEGAPGLAARRKRGTKPTASSDRLHMYHPQLFPAPACDVDPVLGLSLPAVPRRKTVDRVVRDICQLHDSATR